MLVNTSDPTANTDVRIFLKNHSKHTKSENYLKFLTVPHLQVLGRIQIPKFTHQEVACLYLRYTQTPDYV